MATFLGPNGSRPSEFILKLAHQAQPTVSEALFAGQAMRTRIRERTAAGVDYTGQPFAEYAESTRREKIRHLGHADTVDLFGFQQHPHMLNAIQVVSGNQLAMSNSDMGNLFGIEMDTSAGEFSEDMTPASIVSLVIPDGPEAERARAHNDGATVRTRLGSGKGKPKKGGRATVTLPERRFFDASPDDVEFMQFAIAQRRDARLRAVGGA